MNSVTVGAALAGLLAGWPLWSMVTAGDLDPTSALLRGAMVAAGCSLGVAMVVRLALSYEHEAEVSRTRKLDALFTDMADAVAVGKLVDDDAAAGATPPPAPDPADPGAAPAPPPAAG